VGRFLTRYCGGKEEKQTERGCHTNPRNRLNYVTIAKVGGPVCVTHCDYLRMSINCRRMILAIFLNLPPIGNRTTGLA
jgi:hypothetical protein